MLIKRIRSIQPDAPDCPPDWRSSLGQILVAIDTDTGLTGYGVGGGGRASIHIIESVLEPIIVGQNAENIESLWSLMYRATLPFGRKGLAIMAISGVDLALWDLRGKKAELPVARLLGGSIDHPIPTYSTLFSPDVLPHLQQGQRSFKIHVNSFHDTPDRKQLVDQVTTVRNTIGPDCDLMFDAFMSWDLSTTLQMIESFEPLNLLWLEEPLPCDDLDGYEQLSRESVIPIAGGEHEYTSSGFSDLVNRRLHTILQPDVCWCGGLTELIKIYQMGTASGIRVCPHRGAEPWGLHAIAALDPDPLAESGRPWIHWLGNTPRIENGKVTLNDRPGFGITVNESLFR